MIEVRRQLPRVYYNESRDFQLLGRIFETVLNYNKSNIDCAEYFTDSLNIDDKLVSLLAKTVGFESKHEYNIKNLKIICGCFNSILKYKGSRISIDKAISALLNSQGITDVHFIELDRNNKVVKIFIPAQTTDVILLKDLFEYILPVGWVYTISRGVGGDATTYTTAVGPTDTISGGEAAEAIPVEDFNIVAKLNDYDADTAVGLVSKIENPEL